MANEVDLRNYRDLVKAHENVEKKLKENAKEREALMNARDDLRKALSLVFGDAEEGMLDGRAVLRRKVTGQFAVAQFAKEHPDMAKQFEVAQVKWTTDTEALSKAEPEVYAKYLTVRWYGDAE